PASRITAEASGRRWALLAVGLIQLLLALPPILLGREAGASVHLAHELGAWDLALAVALVLVAFRPERAPGLVPFALALVGAMVVTAAVDVLRHRAQLPAESHHLLNLAGAWLLWSIARHEPEQGVLLHGLRRSGPSLTAR
ncbi:MAG: hypothetical protein JWM89_3809, partial [Acidimicrobiales bacterium]|nr:hypothetical protein [Acidimicrobiales bacterium]